MTEAASALLPFLLVLPVIDWVAATVLITLAVQRPHIDFLTERAISAVAVSLVTTIYAIVAVNTHVGFTFLNGEQAVVILRVLIILLGLTPIAWLLLYLRRR